MKSNLFRIGDVSRMLQIPRETIRYYEDYGILHPARDQENGYRYYTLMDQTQLLQYKKYRELGLSMEEIARIMESGTMEDCRRFIMDQLYVLENEKKMLQRKIQTLQNDLDALERLEQMVGKYTITQGPDLYYQLVMSQKDGQVHYADDEEALRDRDLLCENYFFTSRIIEIARQDVTEYLSHLRGFSKDTDREIRFSLGFGLDGMTMSMLKIRPTKTMHYFPGGKCVQTVFKSEGEPVVRQDVIQEVMDFLHQKGLVLSGNILCFFAPLVRESGKSVQYFILYAPIE